MKENLLNKTKWFSKTNASIYKNIKVTSDHWKVLKNH